MLDHLRAAHPALKLGYVSGALCAFAAIGQLGASPLTNSRHTLENPPLANSAPAFRFAAADPATAQRLNAATPVTPGALYAARPFVLTGDGPSRARALTCMTEAVYYEAASEPVEGQRAVAQVILNRVRHPLFPHSICGVVYQGASLGSGCQFSFVCDGSLLKPRVPWAWANAEQVARAALAGHVDPAIGDATHYHATYVAPYWAPTVLKVAQIGAHVFYRWAGDLGLPGAFNARYTAAERVPVVPVRSRATPTPAAPELQLAMAPGAMTAATRADAVLAGTASAGRVHLVLDADGYGVGRAGAAPGAVIAPPPALAVPAARAVLSVAVPAPPTPAVVPATASVASPAAALVSPAA